jgi:hypothetical protein
MRRGSIPLVCRVIAKRAHSPVDQADGDHMEANVTRDVQTARNVVAADIGKFVVSVRVAGAAQHQYYTPSTAQDSVCWPNGLENVAALGEGFALFTTASEAYAAVQSIAWTELSIYAVVLVNANTVLFDERLSASAVTM